MTSSTTAATATGMKTNPPAPGVMDHALARWSVLVAAMLASGAVAWSAVGLLRSPRGVAGPGIVDAISPLGAAAALLAVFILCSAIAVVVGRLLNPVVGLFTLGAGLSILSMRTGTIRDASFDGGSLVPLAVEGLVWGVLVAVASIVVHRCAKETPGSDAHGGALPDVAAAFTLGTLKVAALGALAIIGIWLLVTSPLKGQALGAVVVGGVLAGYVARRAAPEQSMVLLFASPILFTALAQLLVALPIADPGTAFVHGSIPNLVAVMPLDLAAGTLVGVAVGIGLAKPG